ncbi:uncharacterized protein TRUGW13939_11937 [Talaromyces rugulosus]|uniref:FAD-binding PCMH-type domain-containing protein n=1 Tax=Talaromyces rugulosus TaxID=121627 RepID=A0A7H8RG74_TALRU|nr:uncharacterized protein TRUGW13939_11937 [Talaromyces rugulosus]QKX64761.1 hypothetical protein TRUGW13939_11937 [Talaromyces rugulosus]
MTNKSPVPPKAPSTDTIIRQIVNHQGDERFFEYSGVEEHTALIIYNALQKCNEGRPYRCGWNSLLKVFSVVAMVTEIHEFPGSWMTSTLVDMGIAGFLTRQEATRDLLFLHSPKSSTFTGQYQASHKEPDYTIKPLHAILPTVVFETGWSESAARLREDMRLWLVGGRPAVQLVFLIKFKRSSNGRVGCFIEQFELDSNGDIRLIQAETVFPAPANAAQQTMAITKRQIWGAHLPAGQNPDASFDMSVDIFRDSARSYTTLYYLKTMKNCSAVNPIAQYNTEITMTGNVDIRATLAPKLSSDANIFLAGDTEFPNATARWSQYKSPGFTAVVEVATEGDVVETVISLTFVHEKVLTQSNGIQIKSKRLDSVNISDEGDIATCGGGIIGKTLVDAVESREANCMIVAGRCEITSLLGPGLGGGHGFLQGKDGLISDQFVSARIVLADGSIKGISADSGDPDLGWVIQGAGHNFGLVTSISVKIYDIEEGDVWSHRSYTFALDKAEPLYELVNKLWPDGTTPSHLTNFSFRMLKCPVVEPSYSQQFDDIGPTSIQSGSGPFNELSKMTGLDESAPASKKIGLSYIRFPVNVRNYNIKAQREAFDIFTSVTKENPEFAHFFFMSEG